MVAEIGKPFKETLYGLAGVEPAEVVGAEVNIDNAVGEHVSHCGEHRSGKGEDSPLGAAFFLCAGTGRADRCFSPERQPMRR